MKKGIIFFMFALLWGVSLIPMVFAAATPKPEGEIVLAVSSLGREIWGPLDGAMSEQYPAGMWNEKLLYRGQGSDEKIYGGLAESWTVSNDKLTYTFKIRKGIQFNEGWGPFTAEDALYSLQLIGREDSLNVNKHIIRDWTKKLEVVDPYTLRLTLKDPHPDLVYWLSDYYPYLMMVSKKHYESVGIRNAAKHPVGTGPWVFKEHVLGDHLTVEAVDNHWRKTPEFKRVTMKIVPELGTRIAMLRAGEAALASISTASIKEVENANFKILTTAGAAVYSLMFGGLVLPTREAYDPTCPWAQKDTERALKVRKAMSLAINRQEILDYILKGKGNPFAVHEFMPGGTFTNPAWKPYPYDPKEAKRLLTEAGYPNGFEKPITMYLYTFSGREEQLDIGEAISQYWERIGLKVKRQRIEFESWKDIYYTRSKGEQWSVHVLGSTPYPEPVVYYGNAALTTTRVHQPFESLETDKMINSASTEIDPELRKQKQLALGQYIYDNYLIYPIALKDVLWAASGKVSGWSMNSINPYLHNLEYIHRAK